MKRTKAEQVKRYLIFLVGLFVNSLGVSLITKGNLGTSPISSISLCTQPEFPIFSGKLHHCIQFASDLSSVFTFGKEF